LTAIITNSDLQHNGMEGTKKRHSLHRRYLGASDVTNTKITEYTGLGFCVWVPLAAKATFQNLVKRRG